MGSVQKVWSVLFSTLLFILLFRSTVWAQPVRPIVFILFDAGETNALLPVFEKLRFDGTPFQILPLSTSRSLLKDCPECVDLKLNCQITTAIPLQASLPVSHEDLLLSDENLTQLTACLEPALILTGAPSMTQFQIAERFKEQGTRVIAYFDAFSPVLENSIGSRFLEISDEFWVPSESVRVQAEKMPHLGLLRIAGQPTLETWAEAAETQSRADIRKQLPGFDQSKKTLLLAGGYGTGYAESVDVFYAGASEMKNVQVLISVHPRMGDALELEKLRSYPDFHPIFVPPGVGTMKAALVSDLLVSENSTAGLLTLFAGGKSLYLDPVHLEYSNLALELGLARKVSTKDEFIQATREALQRPDQSHDQISSAAQIPAHSAELMARWLEQLSLKTK